MRFRVERDVLAEAVCLGWRARLPTRPPAAPGAWPACCSSRATGGLTLSGFDYEVSAAGRDQRADRRGAAGRWSRGRLLAEIARSLPAQPVELVDRGTTVRS